MLIDAIADTWPPLEDRPSSGYLRTPLADMRPIAATALPASGGPGLAIVVAARPSGELTVVPLVREGAGWRRARPRDGAASALVTALASGITLDAGFGLAPLGPIREVHGERAMGVDQTNESLVVGGSVVVKWLADPSLRSSDLPDVHAHLASLGYPGVPRPLGSLIWRDGTGQQAAVAFLDTFLVDARDGWDWCVHDLLEHVAHAPAGCPTECAAMRDPVELGTLAASLHLALATPSPVIAHPRSTAGPASVGRWVADAETALGQAGRLLAGEDARQLKVRTAALRRDIRTLAAVGPVGVQPIHGDLHVGQVLRSPAGLHVIDLDDDISVDVAERGRPLPVARDVAQMVCSLDHVGRLAARRAPGDQGPAIELWIGTAQAGFLDAYRSGLAAAGQADLFDERSLRAFTAERICRELVYAARVLPRWLHAPMGTLGRLYPADG